MYNSSTLVLIHKIGYKDMKRYEYEIIGLAPWFLYEMEFRNSCERLEYPQIFDLFKEFV